MVVLTLTRRLLADVYDVLYMQFPKTTSSISAPTQKNPWNIPKPSSIAAPNSRLSRSLPTIWKPCEIWWRRSMQSSTHSFMILSTSIALPMNLLSCCLACGHNIKGARWKSTLEVGTSSTSGDLSCWRV